MRSSGPAAQTSTSGRFTTATPTPSWSRWRTTASAARAKAASSPPAGRWHPAGRCPPTPAAASCRRSTCGNDAVAGSRHSGPGPGRPAAGPPARDRDRQRQRRSARPPRDPYPRSGAMTAPAERTTVTARRDDRSTPWFDALARDILLIRRCPRCGTTAARTPPTCPACHADELEWGRSRGTGTVVSVVFDHGGRIRYPSASSSWTRARGWLPGSSLGRRHRPAAG